MAVLPKGVGCEVFANGFETAPAGAVSAAAKGLFMSAPLLKLAKDPPLFAGVEPRPLEIGALGVPKAEKDWVCAKGVEAFGKADEACWVGKRVVVVVVEDGAPKGDEDRGCPVAWESACAPNADAPPNPDMSSV